MNKVTTGLLTATLLFTVGVSLSTHTKASADVIKIEMTGEPTETTSIKQSSNIIKSINKGQSELDSQFASKQTSAMKNIESLNLKDKKEEIKSQLSKAKASFQVDRILSSANEIAGKNNESDKLVAETKAKEEAARAEQERQARAAEEKAEKERQAQAVAQTAQTSTATTASASGLNLSQTSGAVDINALANYMVSNTANAAGYSASEWAYIISRESGGNVSAMNASSGAYGALQLLGHGEYQGMPLSEQAQMAAKLPAGSWVVYG